ncbi:hypothetical protein M5689_024738 [Euphorbia peplus]|nr:hypothetical protein M5689_024738 [Euphorbia peplus]
MLVLFVADMRAPSKQLFELLAPCIKCRCQSIKCLAKPVTSAFEIITSEASFNSLQKTSERSIQLLSFIFCLQLFFSSESLSSPEFLLSAPAEKTYIKT